MLVASLTAWTLPANGASLVWVGGSGTWDNTIANWTPGPVAWVNGTDTAVFNGGSGTVTLGVPITAGGLTFNNSDYTIAGGGNVLTLGLPAGTPSPVIAVNNTAGTFPARAVISAQLDGTSGFTKTGNGTLLLTNNSNGISGDVSIKQGALIITNGSQLGTGTTAISVTGVANSGNPGYSGGSLVLQGVGSSASATGMTLNREVSISGRGPTAVNNTGGVVSIGYNTLAGGLTIGTGATESRVWATHGTTTVSGTLNLGTGGSQIFQGNGNWNISGLVTGVENSADRLIKVGTVVTTTMWLQNAANNYANTLRIDSGTVRVQTNGALGISTSNQAVDLQNATLEVRTDAGAGFLTRNVTQRDNTSGGVFVDHDITGPLGIGSSLINQTVTFGRLGRTTGTNAATFAISGRNGYNTSFATLFGAAANGALTFNNNSNGLVTYTGDVNVTNDATARAFTVGGSSETLITGSILASGAAHTLTKSGTGTFTLQGTASNYTGATAVQQGTLSVNQAGALGNNTTNLNIGSGASTGTLNYLGASGTGAGETTSKPVNLAGGTGGATILANQAGSSPSPLIFNGTFTTATTAKTLTLGGSSTQLNEIQSAIPNPASGNLTLVKNGPGTWVLSGTNAYLGATTITNGTLRLKDTFSGASQNVVQNASAITFAATTFNYAAGGVLEYLGASGAASVEAVGALTPQAGLGIIQTTAQGGGSATLNFASYTARSAGTALSFLPGSGTGIQFAAVPTAVLNGLVSGGYITNPGTGAIDFVATPAINTNIAALNAGTALPATGGAAATNYLLNTGLTTTGAVAANSIRITTGAALTLGAALTITSTSANALGGILHDNAGGASTISGSSITTSAAGQELLIITGGTTPANSLTISSALANGAGGVTKAGSGTLVLSGVNTFTGALNVLSGTLRASGTSASILGVPAAGTIHTLRQGTTLDLNGAGAPTAPYTGATPIPVLVSAIMQGAGNITSTAAGAQAIQFGVAASTSPAGVLSGVISDGAGTVTVIKQGAAASVQALIGLNTYTGPTVITGGILQANTLANGGQPSSIGASSNAAGNLVFNGGILLYQGSNATVFQATQSPSVSTDRLFTLAGAGTIESTGSYGNNVTGTPAGNNAALIFSNTGAVAYNAPNAARSLTLQGGSLGDNEMRINLVDNGSGALSLTKAGGGLWILNPAAANTYTGTTTVSGGALRAIDGQGLSAGSLLTLNGGVLETSGTFTRTVGAAAGQVQLTGGTSGFAAATADRLVVTLGGGTITWGGATFNPTALVLGSSTALGETEFTNNLDLGNAARTVTVNNNANTGLAVTTGILSGVLSGTGGALVKSGAGMLVLGNANTYTGNTTVASSANGQGGLVVTSIGNSTGTVSSSLGASGGTFIMNPADSDSNALVYVGSGETASRAFTMTSSANQTANRVYRLESSGSGALVLNGAFSNTVTRNSSGQTVVLELRGTNTDANQMNMILTNSTGATNAPSLTVQKTDGGVWVLNPASANQFTGTITAAGGLLGLTTNGIGNASSIVMSNGGIFAYGGALTTTKPFTHATNTTAIFAGTNAITINAPYTLAAGNNPVTFSNNLENGALLTITGNLVNLKANNQTMNIRGFGSTLWDGALQDAAANTTAINIAIANEANFTTTGAAANTYTGTFSLLQGTFVADKATAFGAAASAGAVNLNGGVITVGPNIPDITVTNTSVALGGDPARFTGNKNITFTGAASIGGADRVIQNELSGGALLTFSGASMTVNSSSAGRTLVHQGTGNTTISGVLQNNATNAAALLSLNQRGNNTLTLTGDSIMTGSVTVSAGTLALSGGGRLASASSYTVFNGGTLTLDNAVTNNADRLGNAIAITLNGGALNFISNAASTAETVGALTFGAGGSGIAISGTGAANSLTFTSATFGVGSSLNVSSAALGGADKILFTTAPALTPASTGILPRVTVNGADFATYAAGTGVSAFTAYNTAADINTAAATDTFKIIGATTTSSLTGNLTLNALAFDGAGLTAGGSPATNLTLNSGGVLVKGGASTLSVPTVILGAEGLFHVASGSSLSVSSSLQGILGVTKTLGGTLTFTTPQSYLGATTINGGTLVLAGGNNTLLGSQPMAVNLGGTVDLNGNSQYIGSLSSAGNQPGTGGVITNTGAASTLTLNQTVAATFSGQINGNLNLLRLGSAALTLNSAQGYNGTTNISDGVLTLQDNATLLNTSAISINAGTLALNNNANQQTQINDRINNSAPITLRAGTITYTGRVAASASETFGALTAAQGANVITATANVGSGAFGSVDLNFSSLTRQPNTTINFTGTNLGQQGNNSRIVFNAPLTTVLGGALGSWAIANSSDYAAYNAGSGIGIVGTGGYVGYDGTFGPGLITQIPALVATTTTLSGNTTTGMLRISGGVTNDIAFTNATDVLNLEQGGLLRSDNNNATTIGTTAIRGHLTAGGTETSGTRELVVYNNQNTVTINSIIENNGFGNQVALVKSGAGTVLLTGTNTYSGGTSIIQGTLNTNGLAALGTGPISMNGGTLGLLWDGTAATNGATPESLVLNFTANPMTIEGNGGLTVGRLAQTFAPYNLQAVNKTIEITAGLTFTSPALGNSAFTINNNNGYGVNISQAVAMPTSGGTLNFNVATASASNVVQGLTLSGAVTGGLTGSGVPTMVKSGAGTLVLSNVGNTFGGGGSMIDILGGYLSVGADAHLGDASNFIRLSTGSATQGLRSTGTFTTARQLVLNGASSGIEVTEGNILTLSSAFNFTAANNGLAKNDLGTLVLTQGQTLAAGAAANWDGVLTINQGAVRVTHSAALGSTVGNTVLAGVVGSAVELANNVTVNEPLAINPGNNNTNRGILGQGAVRSVSGNNTWAGAITLATTTTDNQNRAASIKADAGATLNLTGGLIGGLGTGGTARDSWFAIGGDGTVNLTTTGMTHTGTVGVYSLVKVGSGTMNIQVASAMSGQQVIVKQGTLSLNGAGTLGVPTLGAPGTVFVNPTANLVLDNSGTNVDNRLGARNFDLRGGNLSILGNSGVATNENFGTLTLNYGAGVITLNPDAANPLSVTHGAVTRNVGSTLLVRGTNLGDPPAAGTATIAGSGTGYAFIGQLGGDTQTFKSILPYAIGDTTTTGLGAGFLTATSAQGGPNSGTFRLRLLSPSEQVTTLLAPLVNTADNVSLSTVVNMAGNYFAGNPFLANSLQLNSGGQVEMTGMRTLTLDSGGILAFSGNLGITNSSALLSTSANRELIVHALGNLTIASSIIGTSGGLVKSGAGTLELTTGFHTYTGITQVNQGVLKLSGGDQTLFPNQNLTLAGGALDLNGSVQNVNVIRADNQGLGRNDQLAVTGGSVINTSATEALLGISTGNISFSGSIGNGNAADSDIAVLRSQAAGSFQDWNLYGNHTYTGASLFNGGRTQVLDGARLSGTTAVEIANATLLFAGSNASAELVETGNRLNDSASVTLRGGMFQVRGYAAQNYVENVGALTITAGQSFVDVAEPGTNLNSYEVIFSSLAQNSGGTVRFTGVDGALGSLARVKFTTAPTLTNNLIGPWALFEREFASYIPEVGVGALNTAGFAGYAANTINTALATDNIRIAPPAAGSTTTLTANRTMNTLAMIATGTATGNSSLDLGGFTLTLQGGGLLLSPVTNSFQINVTNGNITGGLLNTPSELFIHNITGIDTDVVDRDVNLGANLVDNGTGALTVIYNGNDGRGTGLGGLLLGTSTNVTGLNTYTGGTRVNAGRVILNTPGANGTTITATGTGNISIMGGTSFNGTAIGERIATVQLGANSQIANTASVTLNGGGVLDLNGFNQTLGGLVFDNGGGTTPTVSIGTGTLTLNGNITASGNNLGSVSTISTTGIGELSLGGSTRTITVDPVQWQGRILNPYLPNLNITGVVSGTGAEGITKAGTGILQLSGQSIFTGGVSLNAGGLMIGGSSTPSAPGSTVTAGPLGTGTLTIGSGTFLTSSAANNAVANNYVIGGNFSFTGINSLYLNGNTTLPSGATTINVQDPTAVPNAGALVLGGVISGTDLTSSIIKTGLGTLALNNNNTFAGGITLNAGNLVLGGAPASNNASPTSTILVNSADAVLSLMNNGAGSGGVISYSSVIDIASSLPSANLHVGNFSANTANVIEVGNLNLTNTTTLNVSSSNLYSLRLLNLNTTGGAPNINVAAGTTVLVFNYGANQPVNVGPGQLLFPFQPNINSLANTDTLTPGLPSLTGTYPLVPQFAPLGVTAPTGFVSGGLSSSHYTYGSAQNTISVGSSGIAPTAQRTSTSLLGNVVFADRPVGVSPANNTNSSSVYSGLIEITTGGTYTFKTAVDDQSLLIIDGVTVSGVNAAGGGVGLSDNNAASAATGTITLTPGFHTITYKNTNAGSGGGFHLLYSGPDTTGNGLVGGFQAISPSKLYFNNGPATLANGFLLAAGLTNDYTVDFGTTATIDTFGTQFNVVLNSLTLGAISQLNVVNGAGSVGTNFIGVRNLTTIDSGVTINTGGTATSGAAMLNLIGGISDGGNGFKKFGAGMLMLGESTAFSGTMDVLAGTVQVTHAAALSTGANNIGSAMTALATGGTTNGSQTVTLSTTVGLVPGQIINGAGIVPGSYIVSVDSGTQLTISNAATATASNVVVNIGGASLDLNGVTGVTGNINISGLGQNVMIANSATPAASAFTGALWNSSAAPASLNGTVTIGSANTVIGGYGDITINGAVTAAATNNIIFTGAGVNTLTADNSTTLLSAITASAGTILRLGNDLALGDTLAGTTIAAGGILDLNGFTTAENINLSGVGRTNFGSAANSLASLLNSSATASTLGGSITLAAASSIGSSRVNALSGATGGDITINGAISGAFLLTKVGSNTLNLSGANTQSGLTITQGTVNVTGLTGAAGSGGNLTVNASTINGLAFGSRLVFDNTTNAFSSRAGGSAANRTITLAGGEFSILGNASTAVNEAIGTGSIALSSMFNLITLTNAGANVQISTTGTGTVTRVNQATALIRGTALGSAAPGAGTTNIMLGTAPAFTGNTSTTGTNMRIIPWIVADPSATGDGSGANAQFATWDATAGLRPLVAATETTNVFTVDTNVRAGSALDAGAAVTSYTTTRLNSLTIEAGGSLSIAALRNVTLQSGGILAKTSATISGPGSINADANANLIIHTQGAGTVLTLNAALGGFVSPTTGGLAKSGDGTLVLNGQNNYLGETRLNGGTLQIGASAPATNALFYRWTTAPAITATASTLSADLIVSQAGSTLDLNGHNQSSGRLASSIATPGAGGIVTSATAASLHTVVAADSTFSGQMTGLLSFARSGGFTQAFTSDNSYTGATTLYGGVTTLVDQGTLSGTSGISINRSGLRWDDSGLQALSGRLASTIDLSLTGGGFEFRSRSGLAGSISIDDVTLNSGASYLLINVGNAGVGSATMNIDTLIRTAGTGAAVTFAAANGAAGDNPFFKLGTAPTLVNGIIGPWATTFSSLNPGTGTPNGAFATYDPVVGIRPMSAYYEKTTFATATATDNLRFGDISPIVPDGGTAANTLVWNGLSAARTMTFGNATDTLTLTAGGLITGNENFAKTIGSTALRGKLTTSASEFFIYNTANTLTIHSDITGNFDLILGSMSQTTNTPTISLTAPNTYVGNTFVNGMVVTLNNTTGSGDAITGNLTVAGGTNAGGDSAPIANAAVRLLASNQIADSAAVTVRGGSQLDLNGFSETVASLALQNDGGSNANQGPLVQTGGGTLTITSGNITAAVQGQLSTISVIAGNVVLGSTATVDVGLLSGSEMLVNGMTNSQIGLALNANVKGATTLDKTGAGVLQLGGVSDSVTQINVNAGALTLGGASNYRNAALNLSAGTILDMRGATNTAIGTISGSGVIKNFNPTTAGTLVTGNSTNGTFSGQIMSDYTSGLLNVTKIGTGVWTLTGDNDGNLLNTLQINGGEVKVEGAGGSLGFVTTILGEGGTLTLNNATDALGNRLGGTTSIGSTTANRALSMRGGVLNYIGGATAVSEVLNTVTLLEGSSMWNLTSSGDQTVISMATLTASSTTNRGALWINAGALSLGTAAPGAGVANVFATTAANTVGGIRPDVVGTDSSGTEFVTYDATNGFRLLTAALKQALGTASAGTGSVLPAIVTNGSANLELASTAGLVVGQTVSGAGIPAGATILAIVDATNVTLSVPATATSDTRLTFGSLDATNSFANGSMATIMQADTVNSLTLDAGGGLLGSGGGITNSPNGQAWSLAGAPVALTVTSGGILAKTGNTGITGIGVTAGGALLQLHAFGDLAFGSSILGTGGVSKNGAGILTLSARSYNTGAFFQNEGTTRLAAGVNTLLVVPTASGVTVADLVVNGGTLDLNGNTQAVRQVTHTTTSSFPGGAGSIVNTNATAATLYTVQSANTTFSGTLGGTGGNNFSVDKSGNFTWTLQTPATYTGTTAVRGGTLTLTDSAAITGGGAISVNYSTLAFVNNGLSHVAARTGTSALTFNGANLSITPRLEGDASVTTGAISLAGGVNTVTFAAQPGIGASANLNSTSLARSAGATLNIPAPGTGQLGRGLSATQGQSPQWTLTTAPTVTNNLVGGWAVYNGAEFLTYLSTPSATGAVGFGVLGDTGAGFADYTTIDTDGGSLAADSATRNGKYSGNFNYNVNGSLAHNSIVHSVAANGNNLTYTAFGDTLTLTSGGFLHTGNFTSALGQALDWGRITSSASELFMFNNQNVLTINSRITGTARSVFSSGTGGSTIVLANGTARSTVGATVNNGSATVVPASFASLYVGQAVSGPGIPANTTITAINGTTDITLSAPATASGTIAGGNFLTFGTTAGTVTQNTTTNSTTTVTLQAANANLYVGMPVNGTGIAAGTTITAINGTTVTLSQAATANGTNVALVYGTAGNSYSGGTTVNNGTTLQLVPAGTNQTVLPAGGLVINGGAVNFGASTTNFGLIAAANAVTINGGGSLTFPAYTGGVAYTNTLASLTFNGIGGTNAPTVALGTPAASTTHRLILTGATPITSTNDNNAVTPVISGNFTSATQFSSIEFSNAAPTISVAGGANAGLVISAPITQNSGMTGVLTKAGAGTLILTSGASSYTTGTTLSAGAIEFGASTSGAGIGSAVTSGPIGTGALSLANNTTLLADGTARTISNNISVTGANVTFGGTAAGHNLTLNGTVALGAAARTFNVVSPQVTTTVNGIVSGTAGGLTKAGAGVLVLNPQTTGALGVTGATTTSGSTTLNTAALPAGVAVGMAVHGAGIQPGTTVASITGNDVTLSLPSTISSGTASIAFGTTQTYTPTAGTGSTLTVSPAQAATLAVGSTVTGVGIAASTTIASIDTVTGVVTLNNALTGGVTGQNITFGGSTVVASSNTYVGTTTVSGGLLRMGNANAIPTASPLAVNVSGALDLNGNSLVVSQLSSTSATTGGLITNSATSGIVTLTVGDATNTSFGGAITNNVGSMLHLAKQGTSILTLGGPNSYSGTTTVVGGGITSAANNVLPDTTLLTIAPLSGSSTVNLAGFSDTIAALTFSGASGTTAAVTTGAGTLTVFDAITYDATNNPNGATISGNLNLGGDQKNITVGDSTAAAIDLTISATITDTFSTDGITKNGTGTLALTAVGSTYSGPTIINGGTVRVSKLSDGGVASSIGDAPVAASNLVINGATLAYIGNGDSTNREMTIGTSGATIDSSGTGAVSFTATAPLALSGTDTARTLNLVGSNTGTNSFAPQITDNGTGATTVVKDGAGLWALAGNNTYTGPTNVNNGTFLANNTPVGLADSATGTGSVTIASGATLGGTGSIVAGAGNDITITGTLTPGTPGVSVGNDLVIRTSGATGDITLSNTTNINIFGNVVGSNPLASNNRVVFGADDWANIIFGGSSVLNINDTTGNSGTTWTTGDSWQIFDWSGITAGAPPVTGFATVNLPTLSGALVWDTSALYTSGIIAIGVPEPSRLLLLMLGLFGFLSRRRRK